MKLKKNPKIIRILRKGRRQVRDKKVASTAKIPKIRIVIRNSERVRVSQFRAVRIVPKVSRRNIPGEKKPETMAPQKKEPVHPTGRSLIVKNTGTAKPASRLKLVIPTGSRDKDTPKFLNIVKHIDKPDLKRTKYSQPRLIPDKRLDLPKKPRRAKFPVRVLVKPEPGLSILPVIPGKKPEPVQLPSGLIPHKKFSLHSNQIPDDKNKPVTKELESVSRSDIREPAKKVPDRWSDCGQIFYTGGKAFGISSNLRTICIGTQSDVDSFFQRGKIDSDLNFIQMDTLKKIKEIRILEQRRAKEAQNEPENQHQVKPSGLKAGRRLYTPKKISWSRSGRKMGAMAAR